MPTPPPQPAHQPTDDSRKTARMLSGFGVPQEQIAAEIGVSLPTLHKYYRVELDAGMRQANARVAQALFNRATGDGPQSVTAAIFWLKARAGWKDTSVVEHTGKDGAPIQTEAVQREALEAVGDILGQIALEKHRLQ